MVKQVALLLNNQVIMCFNCILHWILTIYKPYLKRGISLYVRSALHPHFTDEKTEAQGQLALE